MRGRLLGACVLLATLVFVLLAAGTVRALRPWVEEAWYGTPAWMLVEAGYMGTSLARRRADRHAAHRPAHYALVRERLRDYQVVYDRGIYEVVARRSAAKE